jgi:hypothetical protein
MTCLSVQPRSPPGQHDLDAASPSRSFGFETA